MEPTPNYTARLTLLLEQVEADSDAVENGWEIPQEPKRYLAVEIGENQACWAANADTLAELAKEIDESETSRSGVTVYDLDTGNQYVPVTRTTAFACNTPGKVAYITVALAPPAARAGKFHIKPAGQCPITVFNDRELNTVLHSLEVLKEIRQPLISGVNAFRGCRDEEMNKLRGCSDQTACDHFEEVEPLTHAEIDALCARLQLQPEPVQSVDMATRDKLADDSTHAIAALCKDQTGRELTTDELDDLNDRITAFFVETLGKRSTK